MLPFFSLGGATSHANFGAITRTKMIYITGFPHTGTSFLAEIVLRFGFNFGDPDHLKGANQMNCHGHFEHLLIRDLIWDNIEKYGENHTLNPCDPRTYQLQEPDLDIVTQIQALIDSEQVEVYKDTFYPVIHKYLPPPNLILTTYRSPQGVYLAPIRSNMHQAVSCSVKYLNQSMSIWYTMLKEQHLDEIIKLVNYDKLFDPSYFRSVMEAISGWLAIPLTEELFESCQQAWDPLQELATRLTTVT